MGTVVLNLAGVLFFVVSFGIACGLRATVLPRMSHLVMLGLALGLCVLADVAWRLTRGKRKWFAPASGATVCLLPLWAFALLWMAKAGYEAVYGPIPAASMAGLR